MAAIIERQGRDGKPTFQVKVRLLGHEPLSATFRRKSDAREWAASTEAAIREGRYFPTRATRNRTVADLIDRYRQSSHKGKRSWKDADRALTWWRSRIGLLTASGLTPAKLSECRDELLRKSKDRKGSTLQPATVRRYFAVLSHLFSVAYREWQWVDRNPTRQVTMPRLPPGRARFLDDAERKRLLNACKESKSPMLYPMVLLALSTGMRRGEILNLEWKDVDLKKGWLVLHQTKNDERRGLPLTGAALQAMKEHARVRRLDTPLVFPGETGKPVNLEKHWQAALTAAKIKDFRFHDLRHSAASELAMGGASPGEIAAVLGHKTLQMVKRYAHLSDAHTADVVRRMNERVFGGNTQ
jgi:integrase